MINELKFTNDFSSLFMSFIFNIFHINNTYILYIIILCIHMQYSTFYLAYLESHTHTKIYTRNDMKHESLVSPSLINNNT